MPATKVTATEIRRRTVLGIIEKRKIQAGASDEDLARRMHMDIRTYYNRKANPDNYHLSELWSLCDYLKMDDFERGVMLGGKEVRSGA